MAAPSTIATDPITRQLFDDTISALRGSINDLRGVVDALDKRIQDVQKTTHEALMRHLDERLAAERKAREEAIQKVEHEVAEVGAKQDRRLEEIDAKLDALTGGVERIVGSLDGWKQVMEAREQSFAENRKRIEKLENGHELNERAITLVSTSQAAITQDLRAMQGALYGNKDQPDGPPSISKAIADLGRDLRTGFSGQATQIESIREAQKDLATRLSTMEKAQEAEAQKWADRKAALFDFLKSVTASRYFWAVVGVAVAGMVLAFVPDANEVILKILTTILGGEAQ